MSWRRRHDHYLIWAALLASGFIVGALAALCVADTLIHGLSGQ